MSNDSNPELLFRPFRWPGSGWWLTAIGTGVGVVVFVEPGYVHLTSSGRYLLAGLVALSPGVLVVTGFLLKSFSVFCRRGLAFPILSEALRGALHERDKSNALVFELVRERNSARTLRIAHCYSYDEKAYIALYKKRGFRVNIGDTFTVVEQETGQVLGSFEIIEVREHYIAKVTQNIDPVWFGYILQAGTAHSAASPTAIAMFIQNDGGTHEQGE